MGKKRTELIGRCTAHEDKETFVLEKAAES